MIEWTRYIVFRWLNWTVIPCSILCQYLVVFIASHIDSIDLCTSFADIDIISLQSSSLFVSCISFWWLFGCIHLIYGLYLINTHRFFLYHVNTVCFHEKRHKNRQIFTSIDFNENDKSCDNSTDISLLLKYNKALDHLSEMHEMNVFRNDLLG